jgi:hypothetical protein
MFRVMFAAAQHTQHAMLHALLTAMLCIVLASASTGHKLLHADSHPCMCLPLSVCAVKTGTQAAGLTWPLAACQGAPRPPSGCRGVAAASCQGSCQLQHHPQAGSWCSSRQLGSPQRPAAAAVQQAAVLLAPAAAAAAQLPATGRAPRAWMSFQRLLALQL